MRRIWPGPVLFPVSIRQYQSEPSGATSQSVIQSAPEPQSVPFGCPGAVSNDHTAPLPFRRRSQEP